MLVLANKRICVLRSATCSQGTTLLADIHTRGCFKANKLTNGTLTQSFERTAVILLLCTTDSLQTTLRFVSWYCYSFVCWRRENVNRHPRQSETAHPGVYIRTCHPSPARSAFSPHLTHLMRCLHRGEEFWRPSLSFATSRRILRRSIPVVCYSNVILQNTVLHNTYTCFPVSSLLTGQH
jgi:hypothetical protein